MLLLYIASSNCSYELIKSAKKYVSRWVCNKEFENPLREDVEAKKMEEGYFEHVLYLYKTFFKTLFMV